MKALFAATAAFAALMIGAPAEARYSYPVNLNPNGDNWLALRTEPGGARIMKMGPDTPFTVVGEQGSWAHIVLRTGETGWAAKAYIGCCKADRDIAAPTYVPPAPTYAPTYTPTSTDNGTTVATYEDDGGSLLQYARVTLGNQTASMFIDSGCTSMAMSTAWADALIAGGQAVEQEPVEYVQADGKSQMTRQISVNSVTIGGRTVYNVPSSVRPGVTMLLGIGVLSRFGKFSIDRANHELVLG
jgi:hypothetical protein